MRLTVSSSSPRQATEDINLKISSTGQTKRFVKNILLKVSI